MEERLFRVTGVIPARVLVTGASGQLGSFMVQAFSGSELFAYTRASLDVTDTAAVRKVVAERAPQLIVNCTAFNDVDGSEANPLEALAVNAFAVRSLARAAEDAAAILVHYGTDFVFNGAATEPYGEDAAPSPQSTYAASKLLGEWFALEAPGAFVLRVESLFGSRRGWKGRRGTLDGMVDGLEQGRDVKVFTDRVVSPSYAVDVAAATRHLIETDAAPGLYHCVNDGHGTWEDVAQEVARLLDLKPRLIPMTMDQARLRAHRPRYCALSTRKLAAAGFQMPHWRDALRRWLATRGAATA